MSIVRTPSGAFLGRLVDLEMLFGNGIERNVMQTVQIGYGKATFSASSITIAGFVVEEPFIRTLASKKLGKLGRTHTTPVSAFPDIDGYLYSDSISAPDGTIFLIQTSAKMRGVRVRDGAIFIRARAEGDALLITAAIPHNARSILTSHNHTVFSGHGDILTVDELEAEGLVVAKSYIFAYLDQEELDECYTVSVIAKGKSKAPTKEVHTSASGDAVVLLVEKSNRRIRVRR